MIKRLTYLFSFCLALLSAADALAGTDLLADALTQSNSFLKDAGAVQQKYSGIARQYVTTKTGPGGIMGPQAALVQEKAARQLEWVNNLQEQMNRLQERMDAAQQFQQDMMDRYNELNTMVTEAKEMATSTYQAGLAIKDQYRSLGEDMVNNAKSLGNDMKNMATDSLDQVKGLKDEVANQSDDGDMSADEDIGDDTGIEDAASVQEFAAEEFNEYNPVNEEVLPTVSRSQITEQPNMGAVAPSTIISSPITQPQLYNQADAIRSATVLAGNVAAETAEITTIDTLPELQVQELQPAAVSAEDILAAAATAKENPVAEEEFHSELNFEEQLLQSSNSLLVNKSKGLAKGASVKDLSKAKTNNKRKDAKQVRGKFTPRVSTKALIEKSQAAPAKVLEEAINVK